MSKFNQIYEDVMNTVSTPQQNTIPNPPTLSGKPNIDQTKLTTITQKMTKARQANQAVTLSPEEQEVLATLMGAQQVQTPQTQTQTVQTPQQPTQPKI